MRRPETLWCAAIGEQPSQETRLCHFLAIWELRAEETGRQLMISMSKYFSNQAAMGRADRWWRIPPHARLTYRADNHSSLPMLNTLRTAILSLEAFTLWKCFYTQA